MFAVYHVLVDPTLCISTTEIKFTIMPYGVVVKTRVSTNVISGLYSKYIFIVVTYMKYYSLINKSILKSTYIIN